MASKPDLKPAADTTPPATDTNTTDGSEATEATTDAPALRIAQLEAELAAVRGTPGETRTVWVVTYPAISVQPKDDDGNPVGEPAQFERGSQLSPDTAWQGPFLRSIGHVTQLTVPA